MKGCSKFGEQLSAYIDRELGSDEAGQIEEHLKTCTQCCSALDDLRKTVAHLGSLDQADAPPWLTQRVMTRIKAEDVKTEGKGFFAKLFRPLYVKVPIGALATVLLAATTYFFFQDVIPQIQDKQSKQYSEKPAEVPETKKKPEQAATIKKKLDTGEHAAADRIVGKVQQAELPRQKAEDSAPAQKEMRAGTGNAATALTPADSERPHAEKEHAFKAMKYGSAQRQGSITHDESMSRPAKAPSAAKAGPAMAEKASLLFHVSAEDPADTGWQVAGALTRLGAKAVKTDFAGDKTIVRAELDVAQLREFFDMLNKIGPVQEKMAPSSAGVNSVVLTVEILPATQQP